jgi:hypothetical protein
MRDEPIPFAIGGLVLLWGLLTFALATSGGERAGLHEVAAEPAEWRTPRQVRVTHRRRMQQEITFVLAALTLVALAAFIHFALPLK